MSIINYFLISKALKKYKKLGYQYIEVPWAVDKLPIDITVPSGLEAFPLNNKYLVGSAEQSFLQLILENKLKSGKYVAVSPCFRNEVEDYYHKTYFFKVELIHYSSERNLNNLDLNALIIDAKDVLSKFTDNKIKIVNTLQGLDLEIKGVEVGSYGIRQFKDFNWVYGTGIAEPRFSQVR